MIGKVVGSAISLILVVGVVIGVVVYVQHKDERSNDSLSPQMKVVTQFCEPTNYKEACTETLFKANTTDPKELIKAGVLAISAALSKALNTTDELFVREQAEPQVKMGLGDCKNFLREALEDLQETFTKIGDSDVQTLVDQEDDFRTWLSSIIVSQETCLEGFPEGSQVRLELANSTKPGNHLTDNVLAIFQGLSDLLKNLGIKSEVNPGTTSRRLLQDNGYPTWMSAAERKLLASRSLASVTPNAIVAQDGSGHFKTVQAAVDAFPKNHTGQYVIYVKAGLYRENVFIKNKKNLFMYGDGPMKTIITGNKNGAQGLKTQDTGTVIVESNQFMASSIGIVNTAGPQGNQAVALRVKADKSAFYNVRLDGYQDTLYCHDKRQFYRNCVISGTIDFIFGFGEAIIQNSRIIVRKPSSDQLNTITANGREEKHMKSGIVLHNCQIVAEQKMFDEIKQEPIKTYLGRPWRKFSLTVVMESTLGGFIDPEGWSPWEAGNMTFTDTLQYGEFGNDGPGSNISGRVKWKGVHQFNKIWSTNFTVSLFFKGGQWIDRSIMPVTLGFVRH